MVKSYTSIRQIVIFLICAWCALGPAWAAPKVESESATPGATASPSSGHGSGHSSSRDAQLERPSIDRADLAACNELHATVQNGSDLDPQQLSSYLNGTWVRQLTWNGIQIETESGLYFDFLSSNPSGLMFDRSNLGEGPLTKALESLREDPEAFFSTPSLTFVDCEFGIVDQYFKISSGFVFDGLPVTPDPSDPLHSVWAQLIGASFFDSSAFTIPSGLIGRPGGEILTPSIGGAYWQISLAPTQVGSYKGATLRLGGEYRGGHVGFLSGSLPVTEAPTQVQFTGVEDATFFMEGDRFVVSASEGGNSRGWKTDCSDFFELPMQVVWERVVLDPGKANNPDEIPPSELQR